MTVGGRRHEASRSRSAAGGAGSARAVVDVAVSGDLARDSRIVIVNEREHYRLLIESRPLESGR